MQGTDNKCMLPGLPMQGGGPETKSLEMGPQHQLQAGLRMHALFAGMWA